MLQKETNRCQAILILSMILSFAGGCQMITTKDTGSDPLKQHRQIYSKAIVYNKNGLGSIDDPNRAEREFRKAIEADEFYGPAHNNLAIVLKKQGRLYESAKHFEMAVKYMPTNIEPMLNLGQLLEDTGRTPEAIEYYKKAFEIKPNDIRLVQALCRAKIKTDQKDAEVPKLLKKIATEGQNEQWHTWAREQLFIISKTDSR